MGNLSGGYGIMIRLCRSIVHTPKAPHEVERNKKSGKKDKKLDWNNWKLQAQKPKLCFDISLTQALPFRAE
jgi:hypothetical protein